VPADFWRYLSAMGWNAVSPDAGQRRPRTSRPAAPPPPAVWVALAAALALAATVWGRGRPVPSRVPQAPPIASDHAAPRTAAGLDGSPCPIRFEDVTARTGITFRHTDGSSGRRYIVETVTAGLATFDYDGDGDIDIYFLNGAPLRGTRVESPPRNALYRNDGGFRFTDVTDEAGVGDTGYGLGVAVGDYDNDGDPDLYVNNFGPNVLYRNNGDGTFTDVTREAGVANDHRVGAGTNFLDIDGDGWLDLFVGNYIDFTYERHVVLRFQGFPIYAGPRDFPRTANTLYRNRGDGTFADVSRTSGIAEHLGAGMGTVCADYDDDGDTDIFVLNDEYGNFLFRNDGRGRFEEVGLETGFAYDANGVHQGSMGVDCGDYDNDGRLDLYSTSYQGELAILHRNLGSGLLEDVTLQTGAGLGTRPYVTWGVGMVDLDNDGDRDLFVACGHLLPNVEEYDDTTLYHAPNLVLMNTGDRFVNVSERAGPGLRVRLSSRGAAFDDLDGDGRIDVVILNSRREPTVLRNVSPRPGHWIGIRLRGTRTNRDGVGARVIVRAGRLRLVDEVHSGRGYQSHYGTRLHFGLGPHTVVDEVEVRWIGGGRDRFRNLPADRVWVLTEGGKPPEPLKVPSARASE